jgi:putative oxidoreductase
MKMKNLNFSALNPYIPTAYRVVLGAMFIAAGLVKYFKATPAGVAGFFGSLGIPMPEVMAWVVLLSEIVFGACVLLGFRLKYTVWPLVVIMAVALLLTTLRGLTAGNTSGFFFHLLAIVALVDLAARGPGKYAVDKK